MSWPQRIGLFALIQLGVFLAVQAFPPIEGPGVSPRESETTDALTAIARARTIEARPAPFPGDAHRSADALEREWLDARREALTTAP